MGFFCQCKMQKLSLRFKLHANREQDNVNEEKGVDYLFEKLNWFTCFTTSVWTQTKVFSGSKEQQNNNIIILLCKKPEFMLRQVCGPDSKQITFKMLTPWTEFGLIRAMPCWGMAAELTRQSDFHSLSFKAAPYLSYLSTSRVAIGQLWVSAHGHQSVIIILSYTLVILISSQS